MCRSSVLLPTLTRKLGTMANAAINVRVRLFVFLLAALHHSGPARGCREDQFRCADRGCVQAYNKCDGYDDCGDGSDEVNCKSRECPADRFQCDSGHCIKKELKCDGERDCLGKMPAT